jgi:diguanylate cyclase (GGDEF)-like protein
MEFLMKEPARTRRQQSTVGILLMDLDGFKGINDRYGHLAGDKALKRIAAILRATTRDSDVVCRIGGGEFVVIMDSDPTGSTLRLLIKAAVRDWTTQDKTVRDLVARQYSFMAGSSSNRPRELVNAEESLFLPGGHSSDARTQHIGAVK